MNDAKPDVASLPANCRQRLMHEGKAYPRSGCAACGQWMPRAKECEAALAKPASGDGLPDLPEAGYQRGLMADHPDLFTADQMLAIRDAGIAYGRRLATPEQPGSSVQGEAVAWLTDDGRVISGRQKEAAIRDGGASASSVKPYSIPCYTTPPPAPAAEQGELSRARRGLIECWRGRAESATSEGYRKSAFAYGVCAAELSCYEPKATQPEARGVEGMVPSLPGNWPEDASHENGDYECKCIACGATFYGHKRRVVCKVCATPNPVRAEQQGLGAGGRYWRERAEFWRAQAVALGWREVRDAANGEQPEGKWKLVPVEATPKMMHAATVYQYGPGGPNYDHAGRWKAMLAAAPAAPGVRVDGARLSRACAAYVENGRGGSHCSHSAMESALTADLSGEE